MIQTALLGSVVKNTPLRSPILRWFWGVTLCFAALCFLSPASQAQHPEEITPSHVFQETQQIINELVPLLKLKNVKVATVGTYVDNRQPRHAWQKAREVLEKTQTLQRQEGFTPLTLPALYIEEVRPAHVIVLVQATREALQAIRIHNGIQNTPRKVQFRTGKTPSHVFNNMSQISVMLDSLLGTTVTPSNVVQILSSTNLVLHRIYNSEGKRAPTFKQPVTKGKSPRDVYMLGRDIMKTTQTLVARPRYTIQGGVSLVQHKGGRITPTDVLSVAQIILADMQAVAAKAGVSDTIELTAFKPGKTPSDAYNQLLKAQMLIQGLL